jgi:hypothetical protein
LALQPAAAAPGIITLRSVNSVRSRRDLRFRLDEFDAQMMRGGIPIVNEMEF